MAAVMITPRPGRVSVEPTTRRTPTRPVAPRGPVSTRGARRRRLAGAAVGLAVLVMAGKAGAALGDSPPAVPERRPAVSYTVRPGDSLWTVARHVAPDRDPRAVVDTLAAPRHGAPIVPGEVVVWPR